MVTAAHAHVMGAIQCNGTTGSIDLAIIPICPPNASLTAFNVTDAPDLKLGSRVTAYGAGMCYGGSVATHGDNSVYQIQGFQKPGQSGTALLNGRFYAGSPVSVSGSTDLRVAEVNVTKFGEYKIPLPAADNTLVDVIKPQAIINCYRNATKFTSFPKECPNNPKPVQLKLPVPTK